MRDDVEARAEALARRLAAAGVRVTADGRVDEAVAATIIGVARGTMRNWRSYGTGPRWLRAGRVWYALDDLLGWLDDAAARKVTRRH